MKLVVLMAMLLFLPAQILAQRGHAATQPTSVSQVQFSTAQLKTGIRVHYAFKGDASGTPVILLRGYGDSWFSFSPILPLLDNKYRVYILDQRGHGDSDRPPGNYALKQFAEDVLAFMDAVKVKRATVVGHSMGSFVAQHVAAIAPERVNKLVLVGSATRIRNNVVLDLHREISTLTDPVPEKFIKEFQTSVAFRPLPQDFLNAIINESRKLPARVWKEVLTQMLSPEADVQLIKIKAPTLIIWGDKESIFPRSEQDALVAVLKNSVLKVYPDTGHAPNWERPERFADDLQEFLN
jgi:non-heme chloroperoxidase